MPANHSITNVLSTKFKVYEQDKFLACAFTTWTILAPVDASNSELCCDKGFILNYTLLCSYQNKASAYSLTPNWYFLQDKLPNWYNAQCKLYSVRKKWVCQDFHVIPPLHGNRTTFVGTDFSVLFWKGIFLPIQSNTVRA